LLDTTTIAALMGESQWPCVSLYLPTHRAGAGTDEDKLRLKNLLSQAYNRLVAEGMRGPEADRLLEPVSAILINDSFWRGVTPGGMAFFASERGIRTFVFDTPVAEQFVVGDRFYLRPLFTAHTGEMRFFALAIGKGGWRLFAADRASIEPVEVKGAPLSLADETKYDVEQDDLQSVTFASPQQVAHSGRATAVFHGHGGEKDTETRQFENYIRHVEAAVTRTLGAENEVPLVLLGVDYELARYRDTNTYAGLSDARVEGAVDTLTPWEIHLRALAALEPEIEAWITRDLEALTEAEGSPLVVHDPAEIVSAAAAGRVRMLFFDETAGPFGTFDPSTFSVIARSDTEPPHLREIPPAGEAAADEYGWDLVDLAAIETVRHGGEVHAFVGEGAPVHGAVALLRY